VPPFPWVFPYGEDPVTRTSKLAERIVQGPPGQGVEWQTEVGFFTKWEPPYGLVLGQVGFFNYFTVTMSRFSQALAVEALEQFDQRFLS
jgi:hypothetical protein